MGDALMAVFWAGIAAGVAVGLGLGGVIVAVWWFWPDRHHDDRPDDEHPAAADDPAVEPLPGWDAAAAINGWHALENRRRNTDV